MKQGEFVLSNFSSKEINVLACHVLVFPLGNWRVKIGMGPKDWDLGNEQFNGKFGN